MHAQVAIASNALDTSSLPLDAALTIHRFFMDRLQAHGRLVFADESDTHDLLRAVTSGPGLPPQARILWREVLATFVKSRRVSVREPNTKPLAQVADLIELRRNWSGSIDVAVVNTAACPVLGIPLATGLLASPGQGPDVVTTHAAATSPAIERLKDLSNQGTLTHNSPREIFRRDVFGPLAAGAQTAAILDRYYFSKLWRPDADKDAAGHVEWLLCALDAVMAPGAKVHIIAESGRNGSVSATDTAKSVYAAWNPPITGHLSEVSLSLIKQTPQGRVPHDRHMRFSTGSAVLMPSGFDRLEKPTISDPNGMNWNYCWEPTKLDELRAAEQRTIALPHDRATVMRRES
ncbi:hypothetical protein [Micromonospora sp. NBC_01638]|uniref:hypothetical protein n=1 Tax=Micromonospora sp. NBC_01638 TaxID=2975982 RepID=UPI00386C7E25|nr:hypothetical protein OG811_00060 [Micromonospora sp. NBC_01638]